MTAPSRMTALRELGLATTHATCEAPAAIDDAVSHAERALSALRQLQLDVHARAGGRALATEHISAPLGRAIEKLKGRG